MNKIRLDLLSRIMKYLRRVLKKPWMFDQSSGGFRIFQRRDANPLGGTNVPVPKILNGSQQ